MTDSRRWVTLAAKGSFPPDRSDSCHSGHDIVADNFLSSYLGQTG
jgi:hypothetical protein